ncbi:MAG: AsmA-like C-terminal region-containing protein [Gammaproteobacteria bacterium]
MKSAFNKALNTLIAFLLLIVLTSFALSNNHISRWIIEEGASKFFNAEIINLNFESEWHPFVPTIIINNLEIQLEESQKIDLTLEGIKINVDLLRFITFSPYLDLKINKGIFNQIPIVPITYEDGTSSILNHLSRVDISDFRILQEDKSINLRIDRLFINENSEIYLNLDDGSGGRLVLSISQSQTFKTNKYLEGFLNIQNLDLKIANKLGLIDSLNTTGRITSTYWLTFINNQLSFLEGNFGIKGIELLSSSDELTGLVSLEIDESNRFLSLLDLKLDSDNQVFEIPSAFVSLNNNFPQIQIPYIRTTENTLAKKVANLSSLSLKGSLRDVLISFGSGRPEFQGIFEDISIFDHKDRFSIKGINGFGRSENGNIAIKVDSPEINITTKDFFEQDVNVFDLKGDVIVSLRNGFTSYYSENLSFRKGGDLINGRFSHYISDKINDLSLKITTPNNKIEDLKVLFPINASTQGIKSFINESISCGSLKDSYLLYRGSMNNSKSSTQNFQMFLNLEEGCFSIPSLSLNKISFFGEINSSSLKGKILSSDFLGSQLEAEINIDPFEERNELSVTGSFKGPLESYVSYANTEWSSLDFLTDISGSQKTKFTLKTDLGYEFKTNTKDLFFTLNSRIINGSFNLISPDIEISRINSTVNFDNKAGIENSFLDLRLNSEPLRFKVISHNNNFLLESRATLSTRNILDSLGLGLLEIEGNSNFLINASFPYSVRKSPFLKVSSSLRGTEFNFNKDLKKLKSEEVDFNLASHFNKDSILVNFNLEDDIEGKLILQNNEIYGLLIINPKDPLSRATKEEIGKLKITGVLSELRIDEFFGVNNQNGIQFPKYIYVDDLLIKSPVLGDFKLEPTILDLERKDNFYFLNLTSSQIRGQLYFSTSPSQGLIVDLDHISFNVLEDSSLINIWDSFPSSIHFPIAFSSKEVVLNNEFFGSWSFDLTIKEDLISFENLSASFGEFKIGYQNRFSEIKLKENPFNINGNSQDSRNIDKFIEQGSWSIPSETNLYLSRNRKKPKTNFSGIISTDNLTSALGLEYSGSNIQAGNLLLLLDLSWEDYPEKLDLDLLKGRAEFRLDDLTLSEVSDDLSSANNILRLIRVFNVADTFGGLTDIFSKPFRRGFYADRMEAFINIDPQKIETYKPMTFKSGSGEFKWDGYVSRDSQGNFSEIDFEIIMTLPLRDYLPAYALLLGGPLSAGVVYVAGKAFKRPLNKLSSGKWRVWGNIDDIKAEFIEWFE